MDSIRWTQFIVILLSLHGVCGTTFSSCNETITVKCNSQNMLFLNINASTDLTSKIVEKCSGQKECHVSNPSKECVQLEYGCRPSSQTVTIDEGPRLRLAGQLSMFNMVSAGYLEGHYMKARNINCSLTTTSEMKKNKTMRKMQICFYDFAPFATSTDFCFWVNSVQDPLICSGSGNINRSSQIFESTDGWQFGMELKGSPINLPIVRFWITMDISPNDNTVHQLDCSSTSVMPMSNIIGSVLGILGLAIICAAIYQLKRCKNKPAKKTYIYCDIEETTKKAKEGHVDCHKNNKCGNRDDSQDAEMMIIDNSIYE